MVQKWGIFIKMIMTKNKRGKKETFSHWFIEEINSDENKVHQNSLCGFF